MRKRWIWIGIFLAAFMLLAIPVVEVHAEEAPKADAELTRGEFAAMLVERSGMQGENVSPAELLKQKGIIKGYPGGELFLDHSITRAEAAAMVVRALGLDDEVLFSLTSKDQKEWANAFVSWLKIYGLIEGEPFGLLTREEGSLLLDRAFKSDSEALEIYEKYREKSKELNDMSATATANIKVIPRPGVEGEEMLPDNMEMNMKLQQKIVMPDKIYQKITAEMNIPGTDKIQYTSEMYYVGDKVYQQLPDPESGEMKWYRYPDGMYPDLGEIFEQSYYTAIPPELEKYVRYRLAGKAAVDDEEYYLLASYGSIDDFGKFVDAVISQMDMDQQMTMLLKYTAGLLDRISIWGIQRIGVKDFSDNGGEMVFVVTLVPEFEGQSIPIKGIQMKIRMDEVKYNQQLTIDLPPEVENAPVLDFNAVPQQ
ncbi:MAG: S-layer homology domain-containing protein [Clostridia bacterium]|nr:S-layer homology domain-containing protein [Clostridia bacterium]